jgi:nucleotide-binding universal stress UspA family protein
MHDTGTAPTGLDSLQKVDSASAPLTITRERLPNSPGRQDRLPGGATQPRELLVRKILVATGFSPVSGEAVARAVALARQCNAELTILHVIDTNGQAEPGTAEDLMKRLWGEGSAQMAQLAWSLGGQVEAQTLLAQGLPWEVIVERSKEFDLVLIGKSRGRKGRRLFSRRTAQRVVENAACPVMVAHDPARDTA